MNNTATQSNTIAGKKWHQLPASQQNRCRRAIIDHNQNVIQQRGYTLSISEVEAEYNNLQRKANAGSLDDRDELLAAQCRII